MSLRIIVTGAGGFVMRNAIATFLAQGHHVIALDRAFDPELLAAWSAYPQQLQWIETDIRQLPDLNGDAIILGAAITASPEESGLTPEAHYRANLLPTLHALEWAQSVGVKRVIAVSSSAVYSTTDGAVSEAQPPTPQGLYAAAKSAIEALISTLHAEHNRDACVIRLSNIYGLDENPRPTRPRVSLVARLVEQALSEGMMRPPNEPARDWTFAPDVGSALLALLQTEGLPHALYNVAAEQRLTPQEIAETIQQHVPDAQIQTSSDPIPTLTRRGYLSSEQLRRDTGFSAWTPFNDGVAQVVAKRRAALLTLAQTRSQ